MKYILCTLFMTGMTLSGSGVKSVFADESHDQSNTTIDMYISHSVTTKENLTVTTAHVVLSTYHIPLNAFELELTYDPLDTVLASFELHENLCEPRFLINKEIDAAAGRMHATCGSSDPFVTGSEYLPVATVVLHSRGNILPKVSFAPKTQFHIHDGFGTRAQVRQISESANDVSA